MTEQTYITDTTDVVSVWSAYGHRFMSTDSEGHDSCLTCGAMYQLMALADDPSRGEYMAANGDAPMECTGDTSMAHGYPDELLSRLPEVSRCADNAIAAALRCGQKQVVRGIEGATGAFVVPLLTPDGCAGVLALEFADGAEQHEFVQALAAIVAAQLSTLFNATPQAIEEAWARPDQNLVAS